MTPKEQDVLESEAAESYWRVMGSWVLGIEGRHCIAKSAKYSYLYAMNFLRGPFPLGELVMAKDTLWGALYAEDVLRLPNPERWGPEFLKQARSKGDYDPWKVLKE